jgi:hypothetical protein
MSVRVMTAVWSIDLPASQKIVLLALADCANDEGHAWPGMASLAKKCSKSERTVQAMLAELETAGHLTRNQVPGKGCNYIVHPRSSCTPEKSAPPQKLQKTPAKSAPKPSRTVIEEEAKASPSSARAAKVDHFPRPEWADPQVWKDWMDVRKAKHGRNTATAYAGFLADIAKLANDEWPPGRLLAYAVAKSWAGIYEPKEGYPTSERPQQPRSFSGQGSTRDLGMDVARELAQRRAGGSVVDLLPSLSPPGRALG